MRDSLRVTRCGMSSKSPEAMSGMCAVLSGRQLRARTRSGASLENHIMVWGGLEAYILPARPGRVHLHTFRANLHGLFG